MSTAEKVLTALAEIAEVGEVRGNLDLRLYDLHLLDSLKTVELMVAFSEVLGVEISPAEFERERWAAPRQMVADLESRVGP